MHMPTVRSEQQEDIHVAGRRLNGVRHICAFFHSKREEIQVLKSFIQEGMESGDKAFHIVNPRARAEHFHCLMEAGIDVAAAERGGRLEVRGWDDAYLKDGHFDQDRQLRLIQDVLDTGKRQGYPHTRLMANMEWALEGCPGADDIVEYESRLNYILPKYDDPVICTYDLSKFGASVVMDMLRTHPVVIIGGFVQENPFYTPPDQFLQELKIRKAQ